MALDPSIILAGRQPDILGAMERGNALVGQVNESRRQNALAQDAQYDPRAAMDMLGRQQDQQWRTDARQYQRGRDEQAEKWGADERSYQRGRDSRL